MIALRSFSFRFLALWEVPHGFFKLMMPHFGFSVSLSSLTHTTVSFGLGGNLLLCLFIKGWGPLVASSVDSVWDPSSSIMSTSGVKDNVGCFAILVVGKVHFLAAPQLNFCLYFSHCLCSLHTQVSQ